MSNYCGTHISFGKIESPRPFSNNTLICTRLLGHEGPHEAWRGAPNSQKYHEFLCQWIAGPDVFSPLNYTFDYRESYLFKHAYSIKITV